MIQEIFNTVSSQLQMDIDSCKKMEGARLKAFKAHYALDLEDDVYYTNMCFVFTSKEDFRNLFKQADTLKESLYVVGIADLPESDTSLHFVSYRDNRGFMELFSETFNDLEELPDD